MKLIQRDNSPAHSYLQAISTRLWTRAHRSYLKYGHNASNIIESLNGVLSDIRCQPPIRMIVRGQVSRWLELGLRFDCKQLHEEKLTRGRDYLSISI
jgi:hypothetical protein